MGRAPPALEVAEAAVAAAHRRREVRRENTSPSRRWVAPSCHQFRDRGAAPLAVVLRTAPVQTAPRRPLRPMGFATTKPRCVDIRAKLPSPPAEKEEFLPPLERQLSALSALAHSETTRRLLALGSGRLEYVRDAFMEARDALADTEVAACLLPRENSKRSSITAPAPTRRR